MRRAKEIGVDVFIELGVHNSYGALTKLGDAVFTGALGQNLRSLPIAYIRKS